jgi:hypothetical protein
MGLELPKKTVDNFVEKSPRMACKPLKIKPFVTLPEIQEIHFLLINQHPRPFSAASPRFCSGLTLACHHPYFCA